MMPAPVHTIHQLAPDIIRLRAPNPSPMTATGTNTYLIGQKDLYILDPGPDIDSHLQAILQAIPPGSTPRGILISHPHIDHTDLVARLRAALAIPVFGFGPAGSGQSAVMMALSATAPEADDDGTDHSFHPDIFLHDGETLACDDTVITAHHTPGHMGAHLCFSLRDALFSGDHVMGWSTTYIAPPHGDMTDYIASLWRLSDSVWSVFYPGHGPEITAPNARLSELIAHRLARTDQVLTCLAIRPDCANDLRALIYPELTPTLHKAAARNILSHLIDLNARNLIITESPISIHAIFQIR
jgi:glyoxylase-like metal-dependent hydrolase (beta-lactamase superfamily II)